MLIDLVDNVMRYSNPLTQQNYCLQVHVRCLFEHSPKTIYMYRVLFTDVDDKESLRSISHARKNTVMS